jgi:hypothetical protein
MRRAPFSGDEQVRVAEQSIIGVDMKKRTSNS